MTDNYFINQNPEQIARDQIDEMLHQAGWEIQDIKEFNPMAATGVAVREYPTDTGPADYILFVKGTPCGVIEAKREEEGQLMVVHEGQAEEYATSKLKWYKEGDDLP